MTTLSQQAHSVSHSTITTEELIIMAGKSGSAVAAKWARVAAQRQQDYTDGVASPRTPWAAAAAASEERYKAGVMEASQRGAFGKGVRLAGDAKWQRNATAKGPSRFAEGVAIAAPDYQAAVQPYLDVANNTPLPPRYAKGDPRNLERAKTIAMAMRKKKTG